jgi:hypothetical protein
MAGGAAEWAAEQQHFRVDAERVRWGEEREQEKGRQRERASDIETERERLSHRSVRQFPIDCWSVWGLL